MTAPRKLPTRWRELEFPKETAPAREARRERLSILDHLLYRVEDSMERSYRASREPVLPPTLLRMCHEAGVDVRLREGADVHEALLDLQDPLMLVPVETGPYLELDEFDEVVAVSSAG